MHIILGIDAGNYMCKVAGERALLKFRSNICDWFERHVEESFAGDDMEFDINGRRGYAGTIAMFEDEFGNGTRYGDSKAHDDAKIRVMLAIHRYITYYAPETTSVSLVTGQPISTHRPDEKQSIVNALVGHHTIDVNHSPYEIEIKNVAVAPEGSAAFWSLEQPVNGLVHILDIGSGTVNAATINECRHINSASATFNFGMETITAHSPETMANGIIRNVSKLKWQKHERVLVCGGAADAVTPYLQSHFPNAELMKEYIYANALGFYTLSQGAFA